MEQIGDPDKWSQLTVLAAQYAPFFFALIFVVFVPIAGQQFFRAFLEQRTSAGVEREAAMRVYTFYWMSGIVTGLVLVALSVAWWFYVQYTHILPARVSIYEGVIRNAGEDDMIMYDIFSNEYTVYVYYLPWVSPPVIRFAVVFKKEPGRNQAIKLNYISRKSYEAARLENRAIFPHEIPLCLEHRELKLVREKEAPPRFDKQC
jgi:hypothetical protein